MSSKKHLSMVAAERLSRYLRIVETLSTEFVSSEDIATRLNYNSSQIRKDLSLSGIGVGIQGRGYRTRELKLQLESVLGLNCRPKMVLVGAGNLGRALLNYRGFIARGFNFVAVLDQDPDLIGKTLCGLKIVDIRKITLKQLPHCSELTELNPEIAVIATPGQAAVEVYQLLRDFGIRAFLNFSPEPLPVFSDTVVRQVDLTLELEMLAFMSSTGRAKF